MQAGKSYGIVCLQEVRVLQDNDMSCVYSGCVGQLSNKLSRYDACRCIITWPDLGVFLRHIAVERVCKGCRMVTGGNQLSQYLSVLTL